MKCPNCQNVGAKVVESRDVANGESIRRRRECLMCHHRYTTYEYLERPTIIVVKKDGMRQLYDRNKLIAGLQRACEKTMMTELQFEELVARIEKAVFDQGDTEITSTQLGDIAMEALADTNQVAYLRFAIVYRNFKDLKSFEQELVKIQERIKTSGQK